MKKVISPIVTILLLAFSYSLQAQWSTDTISLARQRLAGTASGDYILFAGGQGSQVSAQKRVDIYQISTDTWIQDSIPNGAYDMQATSIGDFAYLTNGNNLTTDVYVFQFSTSLWSTISLPNPRRNVALTSKCSKLFFAGGLDGNGTESALVDIYDTDSLTWETDTLSEPRTNILAAAAANKVLFASGFATGIGVSTRVDIYDVVTQLWSVDTLTSGHEFGCAAATFHKIVFAGGVTGNGNTPTKRVEIYNADSGTWIIDSMINKTKNLAAAAIGDNVYIAGGTNGLSLYNTVYIFDLVTQTQSLHTLSQARSYLAGAASGNMLMFAGGQAQFGAYSKTVDTYIDANYVPQVDSTCLAPVATYASSYQNENRFSIYPNPAASEIYFSTDGEHGTIKITNIQGVQEMQFEIQDLHDGINISQLPAGIYLITFQQEKNIWMRKLVVGR